MRRAVVFVLGSLVCVALPGLSSGSASGVTEVPDRAEIERQAAEKLAAPSPGAGDSSAPEPAHSAPASTPAEAPPPPDDEAGTDEGPAFDPGEAGRTIAGEWIVAFEPFADSREAAALAGAAGGRAAQVYERALRGFLFEGSEAAARRLAEHPRIRKVTANRPAQLTAETDPSGILRIQADVARDADLTGGGVTVAVVDTGIDLDHPDLAANVDAGRGRNCINGGSVDDDNGHGTHVAGTVAAVANGSGVVGVAPDVSLVPLKVLDRSGEGSFSDIICAVDHVTRNAASIDVVNMSLNGADDSGNCDDGFLREAICNSVAAGITYTVAAGNDDENVSRHAPANYPEVITVSALDDSDDDFASFSNYGSGVDVIGPGVGILSTRRGGGSTTSSGTSMSAPHAAGVAALALAAEPGLSPAGVRNRLQETGECPDGTEAGVDRSCSGQGGWRQDGDSTAEPLVNALRGAGADPVVDPEPGPDPEAPRGGDPTVDLTNPDPNESFNGTERIKAEASDAEDSMSELEVSYRIDSGPWVAMDYVSRSGEFTATWDTETVADGVRTVTVRVTDRSGATATDSETVTVANGSSGAPPPGEDPPPEDEPPPDEPPPGGSDPVVSLTNPDPGETANGVERIKAEASDAEDPMSELEVSYRIDSGPWVAMGYSSRSDEFRATWDTETVANGSHVLVVRVTDRSGATATDSRTVTVAN